MISVTLAFIAVALLLIGSLFGVVGGWFARSRDFGETIWGALFDFFSVGARVTAILCFLFILWEKFS